MAAPANWQWFHVRVAVVGLTDQQAATELRYLQTELELWEWLREPRVTWDGGSRRAIVEFDLEGDSPDDVTDSAIETVGKIADATISQLDEFSVEPLGAQALGPAEPMPEATSMPPMLAGLLSGIAPRPDASGTQPDGPTIELEPVARLSRPVGSLAFQGGLAITAVDDSGVVIFDVGDPTDIREISACPLPSRAHRLAVAGDFAYVTTGRAGADDSAVCVVSIGEPTRPPLVSSLAIPRPLHSLAASGKWLYVANGYEGLRILDCSDAAHLRDAGCYAMGGDTTAVAVTQCRAYVTNRDRYLRVVDIEDARAPRELGRCRLPVGGNAVAVQGEFAYVSSHAGFGIVSIADPSQPAVVSWHPLWDPSLAVAVEGNIAVAAVVRSVAMLDVSDAQHPKHAGAADLGGGAQEAAMRDGYIYVAAWHAGLHVFKITTSGNTTLSKRD